jgi:hypothetical protein
MSDTETFWEFDPASGTMKPVTVKNPAPKPTQQEQQQQRDAAIKGEITRLYGDVSAQDRLRFWPSIQRKLFPDHVEKSDDLEFKLDRAIADPENHPLSQIEKFQLASRIPTPPHDLVPAHLLDPRQSADTPERRLALADAKTNPSSNIQKTLRAWLKADAAYAATVSTHAGLAATALETRQLLETKIHAAGWKVPKSRVP